MPVVDGRRGGRVGNAADVPVLVAVSRRRPDGLAIAYQLHGAAVHELALRLSRDRRVAQDVTVAVFVDIWRSPDKCDVDASCLRSYLLAESYRQVTVRVGRCADEPGAGCRADSVLAGLDPDVRQMIELALAGGRTYRQIAAVLGRCETAVLRGLRAGLAQAREVMGGDG